DLRDRPQDYRDTWVGDAVNGVGGAAGAQPLSLSKKPISDAAGGFFITVSGTAQIGDATYPPAAGAHVWVDYDKGEVYWLAPPANAAPISIFYKRVNWTDQTIGQALYAGLHRMFPKIGKPYTDISIPIQTNVCDYQLPPMLCVPRSRVLRVMVVDPFVSTEDFHDIQDWERIGTTILHVPGSQRWSPAAQLRIVGWGPYLNLGDLEPELYDLPKGYRTAQLVADEEARRMRAESQPTLADSSRPPLMHLQASSFYMKLFNDQLTDLRRTPSAKIRLRPYLDVHGRLPRDR